MREQIEERCILLANYIVDQKATVRAAAKKFGISKSTVHTDVTKRNGKNAEYAVKCIFNFLFKNKIYA